MITIAVLHFFVQQWFDKKGLVQADNNDIQVEDELANPPSWYAFLPIIPLGLIMILSPLAIESVKIDVVTAMFISIAVAMICEGFCQGAKAVFNDIIVYFDSMGRQFARVVTLVIAGQVFAHGMKVIGLLDTVIDAAVHASLSPAIMIILMVVIITFAAILMGSGNAPFFSLPQWCQKLQVK